MNVTDELTELKIIENKESIYFRLTVSDTFKAETVESLKLSDQVTVIEKNENGTSIEELKIVDEHGTVIENKGLTYYSINESNQKVIITQEEYNTINSSVVTSEEKTTTKDDSQVSEVNENNVTMEDSNASMQTFLQRFTEVPVDSPSVVYTTHVQGYGWLEPPASNGQLSGTKGESKRIEAIKISLENTPYSGGIKYKSVM